MSTTPSSAPSIEGTRAEIEHFLELVGFGEEYAADPSQIKDDVDAVAAVLREWVANTVNHLAGSYRYRIDLTGTVTERFDVAGAGDAQPEAGPDVTISCDGVDLCALVVGRLDLATLDFGAAGRIDVGQDLLRHLLSQTPR